MKKIIILSVLALALTGCNSFENNCDVNKSQSSCVAKKSLPNYDNSHYYSADGVFDESKAKDSIIELMKYYNYPMPKNVKEKIWVSDYGTGKFTEVGLAAIGYENNLEDGYMLQDLFLLPNQMLPEHWHIAPENGVPVKMEGWLIRNGKSYVVGIGENNLADYPEIIVPKSHANGKVTVGNVLVKEQGEVARLKKALTHHWQFAGDKGAIITEVGNNHVNEAVRHYDEGINNHFLGK